MNTQIFKPFSFFVAFLICATSSYAIVETEEYKTFINAIKENAFSIEFTPEEEIIVSPCATCATRKQRTPTPKPWTFLIYMAADNDLRAFAHNNIRQLTNIGSNQHVNILIHMDIKYGSDQKVTRRFFIEKNKIITTNSNQPETQTMDSGDPKTLISACEWAITHYPAEQYALILWNHGTGIIDPRPLKIMNPAELFTFNPDTEKFELDRTVGFLDLLYFIDHEEKGICWDNSTGNYLTNEKFEYALKHIYTHLLHNKKLSIIGFDACLMSMLEVADMVKDYADIMIGSQEVELGTGWNYHQALGPLETQNVDKYELAKNIVGAFQRTYHHITNDFTQSAIDLQYIAELKKNVHEVSSLLLECIKNQKYRTVKEAIKAARNKKICTHFDEPSYIDLNCFYTNLSQQISNFVLRNNHELTHQLSQKINDGKYLIEKIVFANTAGKNLQNARGLSIYLPEYRIHSSYQVCNFVKEHNWLPFIHEYLRK